MGCGGGGESGMVIGFVHGRKLAADIHTSRETKSQKQVLDGERLPDAGMSVSDVCVMELLVDFRWLVCRD